MKGKSKSKSKWYFSHSNNSTMLYFILVVPLLYR